MAWDFQSVAVVGAGAIGLYYGGRLARSGSDVRFLARSDADALRGKGLTVESVHGDFHLPDVRVATEPSAIGPVDLVVVSWKATANHHLSGILPPLLHDSTQVLTLQNGLGNCEAIEALVGSERVLGGLCFVCINRTAPGTISHTVGGRLTVGEWRHGIEGRAERVAERFRQAEVRAQSVDRLLTAQWEKLIWNIPFNGLSVAEGGVTTDVLLGSAGLEAEIRMLMIEVVTAARAQGVDLDDSLVDFNIDRTRPMGLYRTSSMIDFVEGREVEVEPIWREPLRRAQASGVPMPALERLLGRIEDALARR